MYLPNLVTYTVALHKRTCTVDKLMNVMFATKDSHNLITQLGIKEHTLETAYIRVVCNKKLTQCSNVALDKRTYTGNKLMNVMFATTDSLNDNDNLVTQLCIKEHTLSVCVLLCRATLLEYYVMNVMFATKDSLNLVTSL